MPVLDLKINGVSIVLIGAFNPSIFQPQWLALEGLVTKEEAQAADIKLIHPKISQFSIDRIFYEVSRDRFILETRFEPGFSILKDLVLGIFELLPYAPIYQMGINRDFHFQVDSEEKWHEFGDVLAPKNIWEGILKTPRLLALSLQGDRSDNIKGNIRVNVGPSALIKPYGIQVRVNDHYEVGEKGSINSQEIINILKDNFDFSLKNSRKVLDQLCKAISENG